MGICLGSLFPLILILKTILREATSSPYLAPFLPLLSPCHTLHALSYLLASILDLAVFTQRIWQIAIPQTMAVKSSTTYNLETIRYYPVYTAKSSMERSSICTVPGASGNLFPTHLLARLKKRKPLVCTWESVKSFIKGYKRSVELLLSAFSWFVIRCLFIIALIIL